MGRMKEYLLQQQEETQEMWESYLEWVSDNQDIFQQLPKNIQDEVIEGGYYEE